MEGMGVCIIVYSIEGEPLHFLTCQRLLGMRAFGLSLFLFLKEQGRLMNSSTLTNPPSLNPSILLVSFLGVNLPLLYLFL